MVVSPGLMQLQLNPETPDKNYNPMIDMPKTGNCKPAVRVILDDFASRQYNQNVTELDALRSKLERNGTPIDKSDLIRALRRMDALGVGRFLVGRRGQATRFEWHEKSLTVRKLAADEASAQPA